MKNPGKTKGKKKIPFAVLAVAGIWFSALVLAGELGLIALTSPIPIPFLADQYPQPPSSGEANFAAIPALQTPIKKSPSPSPTRTPTQTNTPPATQIPNTPTPTQTPTPSQTPTDSPLAPQVIGYSVEGRPLHVYRFGTGPDNRVVIAGIHGGYEWNTVALADALMIHLRENPDFIPPNVTLYILRVLNPDGLARARGVDGRANGNGVDLNRNWPVNWQENYNPFGCWVLRPITAGTRAASEPETQALIEFLKSLEVTALISYHSAALGIFPGGFEPHPPSIDLAEAVAAVSSYLYPPYDTGCKYTGSLVDWTAKRGTASLDVELHNHQQIDFEQNLRILKVFLNWQ